MMIPTLQEASSQDFIYDDAPSRKCFYCLDLQSFYSFWKDNKVKFDNIIHLFSGTEKCRVWGFKVFSFILVKIVNVCLWGLIVLPRIIARNQKYPFNINMFNSTLLLINGQGSFIPILFQQSEEMWYIQFSWLLTEWNELDEMRWIIYVLL